MCVADDRAAPDVQAKEEGGDERLLELTAASHILF
jgi:hypothetical protein